MKVRTEKGTKKDAEKAVPSSEREVWDVAVIGGGPAGMMAAGRAAEKLNLTGRRARVILIEKNESLGKKLLITGGGRCNVTNAEPDIRAFLEKFKGHGKYLFSAFSQWSVTETLDFFHNRHMGTKTEALQRVFPVSDSAQSVWDVLVEYMKRGGVTVRSQSAVAGFVTEGNTIVAIRVNGNSKGADKGMHNNKLIYAKEFILATGGKSRPETGSTGEGFAWLKALGHSVTESDAALVPIVIRDQWVKRLQGVTLPRVKITLFQNGVKQLSSGKSTGKQRSSKASADSFGRVLFTHFGLSGPTILNLSRDISELLKYGEVTVSLDILPDLDHGVLNLALQDIFKAHSNKKFKNSLAELIPPALAPIIVELSGIDPETWSHSVTRQQRLDIASLLKAIPLHVEGLLGVEKAVVTSGGVTLDEVDFRSMRSRLFPNLFLIGDILNVDRPSGGYSLQLCWTTGFVAGNSVQE